MNTAVKINKGLATTDMIIEAKQAKENLQKTGLHITLAELKEWRDKLKTNPNAPAPQAHK
ncbi:MAG: hypothetical protein IJV56_10235 [Neisseriaceae bacterium]|nr:hypothetical protein [Neisseriaceae bacterium]